MKLAKNITLIIALMVLIIKATPINGMFAMSTTPTIADRMIYSFCHATWMHTILNAWAILSIAFVYEPKVNRLATAYVIAILCPKMLCPTPTVGLSVIIYALLGMMSFRVVDKGFYQLCMACALIVGCLFPFSNGSIHVYAYLCGFIVALFNTPIECFRTK